MHTLHTPVVELIQHPDEFAQLLDLYRAKAPKTVLEIGAGHGGSLYHWLSNAEPRTLIVAVDDNHHNAARYPAWGGTDVELVIIKGDSNDLNTAAHVASFGPYDWVFIDADHHDHAVRRDWDIYGNLTNPGAVVAFHDITPTDDPTVDVHQLWAELELEHKTATLEAAGGYGIGIVYMPAEVREVVV